MSQKPSNTPTILVPKPTKRPYINFFQAFRHSYSGPPKKLTEMAKLAGAAWKQMSAEEKGPFVEMATVAKNALSTASKQPRRRYKLKRLQRMKLFSRSSGSSW